MGKKMMVARKRYLIDGTGFYFMTFLGIFPHEVKDIIFCMEGSMLDGCKVGMLR